MLNLEMAENLRNIVFSEKNEILLLKKWYIDYDDIDKVLIIGRRVVLEEYAKLEFCDQNTLVYYRINNGQPKLLIYDPVIIRRKLHFMYSLIKRYSGGTKNV